MNGEHHFLIDKKDSPAMLTTQHLCKSCKEPHSRGNPTIFIEVKEHAHLLRLYHAVYASHYHPSPKHEASTRRILDECNHFFSGGYQCP